MGDKTSLIHWHKMQRTEPEKYDIPVVAIDETGKLEYSSANKPRNITIVASKIDDPRGYSNIANKDHLRWTDENGMIHEVKWSTVSKKNEKKKRRINVINDISKHNLSIYEIHEPTMDPRFLSKEDGYPNCVYVDNFETLFDSILEDMDGKPFDVLIDEVPFGTGDEIAERCKQCAEKHQRNIRWYEMAESKDRDILVVNDYIVGMIGNHYQNIKKKNLYTHEMFNEIKTNSKIKNVKVGNTHSGTNHRVNL